MTHVLAQRRGMTAIEVLVATMLAALMLASVAGILGSLARQERLLRTNAGMPAWQRQLIDQFLWDLRNARRQRVGRDGIWLVGYGARDYATSRPTGEPAVIQYYLVEVAGDRWLVRRELHPAARTNESRRTEVVCQGVANVRFGESIVDQPLPPTANRAVPADKDLVAVPERISLQLIASGATTPVLDQQLCIR